MRRGWGGGRGRGRVGHVPSATGRCHFFGLRVSLSVWIRCYSIQSDPSDSPCGVVRLLLFSLWLCLALVGRSRPDALISTLCVGALFIPQGKTNKIKIKIKEIDGAVIHYSHAGSRWTPLALG